MKREFRRAILAAAAIVLLLSMAYWSASRLSPVTEPQAVEQLVFLPIVARHFPPVLEYGSTGTAGGTSEINGPWYQWSVQPAENHPQFVRMIKCAASDFVERHDVIEDVIEAASNDRGSVVGRVWLINNEPANPWPWITDGSDSETWQCGRWPITRTISSFGGENIPMDCTVRHNPRVAAQQYIDMSDLIRSHDSNARVFAGGLLGLYDPFVWWWWDEFVGEIEIRGRLDTIQGLHFHAYPIFSTGLLPNCVGGWCIPELPNRMDSWYQRGVVAYGLDDRLVWITETGSAPWCMPDDRSWSITQSQARQHFMEPMVDWFQSQSQYDAMYWFIPRANEWSGGYRRWQCSFLVNDDATLTPLGEYWSSVQEP